MEILPTNKQNPYRAYYAKNSGGNTCGCRLRPSPLWRPFWPWWSSALSIWAYQDRSRLVFNRWKKKFFAEFEHLYQESQKLALARQTELDVEVTARKIQTPYQTVEIPDSVTLQDPKTILFGPSRWQFIPGQCSLSDTERSGDLSTVAWNGKIKKASVPASILIESLVALGLFAMITTLLLGEIRRSRKERLADFKEVEVLSVAQMALQTGQNHLEANGIQVQVEKMPISSRSIIKGRWYCMWNNGKVKAFTLLEALGRSLWCPVGCVGLSRFDQAPACWIGLPGASKAGRMGTFQQQLQVELDRVILKK